MKARLPHAARTNEPSPPERSRSRGIALILAIVPLFFGILGLHRFYLGYTGRGIVYLLGGLLAVSVVYFEGVLLGFGSFSIAALLILAILMALILYGLQISDVVQIINGRLKPKNGEYNPGFFQTKPSIKEPLPEQR